MAEKSREDMDKQTMVARNRKAYHDYEFIDKFEAGLSLLGWEVKSLRGGGADLAGAYARIEDQQCWLIGANIARYENAPASDEPDRKRRLLLHKAQIRKINSKLQQRRFTLVPLRIYFNARGLAKIELALARGKKQYDKRKTITERTQKKDIDRDMKKYRR